MTLSALLRDGTRDAHVRAERSPFMQRILRGTVTREGYGDLLRSLQSVYGPLEEGLREAPAPVRALHPPALWRSDALARDLEVFAEGDPSEPAPAAGALGARIAGLARGDAGGLLAHAYVRYLGDLSGGQVLGRLVGRAFGLEDGRGVAFYRFPEIEDVKAFKVAYREGLDALPLDESGRTAVLEEARRAFAMHEDLFRELEEREAARTA